MARGRITPEDGQEIECRQCGGVWDSTVGYESHDCPEAVRMVRGVSPPPRNGESTESYRARNAEAIADYVERTRSALRMAQQDRFGQAEEIEELKRMLDELGASR